MFFPPVYAESKAHTLPFENEEVKKTSATDAAAREAADTAETIQKHKDERDKDEIRQRHFTQRKKTGKQRRDEGLNFMTANHEQLLRPSGVRTDAPLQSSRLAYENPHTERPGIGLLDIGKDDEYDVFDTNFYGGIKKNKFRRYKTKSRNYKHKSRRYKHKTRKHKSRRYKSRN
jgi:hypothetical protein